MMQKRYWAIYPWDFKGRNKANWEINEHLMQSWASFLWGCTHREIYHFPQYSKEDITKHLAETTVKWCMQYGDKMTLNDWDYMVDKLLVWLSDIEAARQYREICPNISSEYLWYGVFAWHELEISGENVKASILAERIKAKKGQDRWKQAVMREVYSLYTDRWEREHRCCLNCPLAVNKPHPDNFPWCKIYIETGQPAKKIICKEAVHSGK